MEWQTKYTSRKRAKSLYCEEDEQRPFCLLHKPEPEETHLHHLDERRKDETSWFFENLVPICGNINGEIETSRGACDFPQNAACSPEALSGLSRISFGLGDALRSYATARLGSFLAAYWTRPGWKRQRRFKLQVDRNPTVQLATQCILALRILNPGDAVPLALDTLDRSIVPHLREGRRSSSLSNETLFEICVAAGAFHRDYGDAFSSLAYFNLAGKFSKLVQGHRLTHKYGQFLNHWLILELEFLKLGRSNQASIRSLRNIVYQSDYANFPHGDMNVCQWLFKEYLLNDEPERVLDGIKGLEQKYFKANSLATRIPRRKYQLELSTSMHAEYLSIMADANFRLGKKADAADLLEIAVDRYREGRLAINPIAEPIVVRKLSALYPQKFPFTFRRPSDLDVIHPRTKRYGASSFRQISVVLLNRLQEYLRK